MTPSWWAYVLLTLAAFRAWKLVADDRILDRPRDWLLDRLDTRRGDETYWGDFLICPWCAGFWISLLTYAGWIAFGPGEWDAGEWFMGGVSVFAISAGVGLLGTVYYAISGE